MYILYKSDGGLTGKTEGGHALEFRFLKPLPHSTECFAAGLELRPGFRVAQEVGQGALRAAEDPLGENRLRNAVALQFRRNAGR